MCPLVINGGTYGVHIIHNYMKTSTKLIIKLAPYKCTMDLYESNNVEYKYNNNIIVNWKAQSAL